MAKLREFPQLPIDQIHLDADMQMRADGLNEEHVEDLCEALRSRVTLPRLQIRLVEGKYFLTDGFHTYEAHKREGKKKVYCEVRPGTREDAVIDAAGANQQHHGLKRSNKDKRRAVSKVLLVFPDWSARKIADLVGVSHDFVSRIRGKDDNHYEQGDDSSNDQEESDDSETENDDSVGNGENGVSSDDTPEDDQKGDDLPKKTFDWRCYGSCFVSLEGQITALAKFHGRLTPEGGVKGLGAELERLLGDWDKAFKKWAKELAKDSKEEAALFQE